MSFDQLGLRAELLAGIKANPAQVNEVLKRRLGSR
jgi:hypothetical protein